MPAATSKLGFGTASLHLISPAEREAVLREAVDAGLTHFDTSPYYGFGLAEQALSLITSLPGVRIATKVGLYPPGGANQPGWLVFGRKVAGKALPALSKPIADMGVAAARASLDGSRRRLRRDDIDIVLIHEPNHRLLNSDEWHRFIEEQGGRVGAFGVAGEPERVLPMIDQPWVSIVQTRDSLRLKEAQLLRDAGRAPDITFGHFAAEVGSSSPGGPGVIISALRAHPLETVIFTSRKPARIAAMAAAVGRL